MWWRGKATGLELGYCFVDRGRALLGVVVCARFLLSVLFLRLPFSVLAFLIIKWGLFYAGEGLSRSG